MKDLFEQEKPLEPLAQKMRPKTLDQYLGQSHLLAPGKPLRHALVTGKMHSMILWGPPGVGKTSLARLISQHWASHFIEMSAIQTGVKAIKEVLQAARERHQLGQPTVLFVDEVHRFNKAQQDIFLHDIEQGHIVFVGATTENPSFELNAALLSRTQTYVLTRFQKDDFLQLWQRACQVHHALSLLELDDAVLPYLIELADGDARRFLNAVELLLEVHASDSNHSKVTLNVVESLLQKQAAYFDKQGDRFYDLISAFHKSVRGSSPEGALYWLCRMLVVGVDPLYVARRMVRIASEDIGNADPRALTLALDAWQVQERLGHPEGELSLAQCALYLSCAPKSNAVYNAFNNMMQTVRAQQSEPVPMHLRNAPTPLMKTLDYGKDYRYAHDEPHGYAAGVSYVPEALRKETYYQPVERGLERKIKEKLTFLRTLDQEYDNPKANNNDRYRG